MEPLRSLLLRLLLTLSPVSSSAAFPCCLFLLLSVFLAARPPVLPILHCSTLQLSYGETNLSPEGIFITLILKILRQEFPPPIEPSRNATCMCSGRGVTAV